MRPLLLILIVAGCSSGVDEAADARAARAGDAAQDGAAQGDAAGDARSDGADGNPYAETPCDALLELMREETLEIATCESSAQCAGFVFCAGHDGALGHRAGEDPTDLRQMYDAYGERCEVLGCSIVEADSLECRLVESNWVPAETKVCVSVAR